MQVGRVAQHLSVAIALVLAAVLGSASVAADIDVKVLHFGAGDLVRGGGSVAVQLEFRSALSDPIEIEAVWELENADRDITENSRRVLLNPSQPLRRWMYGEMPPYPEGALRDTIYDLRLYEVRDGTRVRDLGTAKIAPQIAETAPQFLAPEDDGLLAVGGRSYGLDIFAQSRDQSGRIPSMNTLTLIGNLRDSDAFPDRWEGYAQFDALIWGGGTVPPARISDEAARAVLEWVDRGGNLVISLPSAGDPWSVGTSGRHGFSDVLPSTAPRRVDDVRVADFLPLVSLSDGLRARDARTRLAIFDPSTLDRDWVPFLAIPAREESDRARAVARNPTSTDEEISPDDLGGRIVGIRCRRGFGTITLLGIDVDDLAARGLQTPSIPQGDVFWNRLLGRRADTPSGAEYTALGEAKRLTSGGYTKRIGDGANIADIIGLSGEAALGVLAATGVFALYWLIAGPLGFAILKAFRREKWSWVAFLAVAAGFTMVIWAVGGSMAGSSARIRHLTVLDLIARAPGEYAPLKPQWRRATSWFSLFAPEYGETRVELDPNAKDGLRNALTSWRPYEGTPIAFPSRERYEVPIDEPHIAVAPSRATSIDFKARWLGVPREKWGEMPSVSRPVVVSIDRSTSPASISIEGGLTHGLPAALENVLVVHVWPVRNPLLTMGLPDESGIADRRFSAQLPNRGAMVSVASWPAGTELNLAETFPKTSVADRLGLERALSDKYYAPLYKSASQLGVNIGLGSDNIDLETELEMLSMYGMLRPPTYLQDPPRDPAVLTVKRFGARELDLSSHFSEPCIVVMGWLRNAELPYAVVVDGEDVPSEGRVLVRWVLPLPSNLESIVPSWPARLSAESADEKRAKQTGTEQDQGTSDENAPTNQSEENGAGGA
ncbi:MAG: phage holin family protein [Limnohabitans sp.]|nr:phage holin family protein [Limnohabitans sp.]